MDEDTLKQHIQDDKDFQKEIREDIDVIKNNHLAHMEVDIAKLANDMDWVKRFFWLVAGTSITAIIGAVVALIFK